MYSRAINNPQRYFMDLSANAKPSSTAILSIEAKQTLPCSFQGWQATPPRTKASIVIRALHRIVVSFLIFSHKHTVTLQRQSIPTVGYLQT